MKISVQTSRGAVPLLSIRTQNWEGGPAVLIGEKRIPLRPSEDGLSTVHMWIDGSIIETFVDRSEILTTRSYASPGEEGGIRTEWAGSIDGLRELTLCGVQPISNDRLTS